MFATGCINLLTERKHILTGWDKWFTGDRINLPADFTVSDFICILEHHG